MVRLDTLTAYADELLGVTGVADYCPNGLQVEGRAEVRLLASGVTASQALLEAAVAAGADALLVHHGWFWKGEASPVVGMKRRRLGLLLTHDVSLLAYHLPLDAHPLYGNNARLAALLDWEVTGTGPGVGLHGRLRQPLPAAGLAALLTRRLGRVPLHLPGRSERIATIAWCGGAAQSYIEQAAALGVDAYLTGEVSEQTVHAARELGLHFFAAGHHATERYGVQALGEHLAERFGIAHRFIDIDNPV